MINVILLCILGAAIIALAMVAEVETLRALRAEDALQRCIDAAREEV